MFSTAGRAVGDGRNWLLVWFLLPLGVAEIEFWGEKAPRRGRKASSCGYLGLRGRVAGLGRDACPGWCGCLFRANAQA